MQTKVIKRSNLPVRLPILHTLVWWLVFERLDAAGWVWGATGAVIVILWIAVIIGAVREEDVDVIAKLDR